MKYLLLLLLCFSAINAMAFRVYRPTAYAFSNPGEQALFVSISNSNKYDELGKSFVFDALTKELLYTFPRFFNMNDVELCSNKDYLFYDYSDSDKKYFYQKIVVYYKGLPHDSLEWKSTMEEFSNSTYSYTEKWNETAEGIYFKFKDGKVMCYSFDKRTFETVTDPDEREWLFCYRSEAELIKDIFSAELLHVGEDMPLVQQLLKDLVIPETVSVKLKLTIDSDGVVNEIIQVESVDLTREEKQQLREQISKLLKTYHFTEPLYLERTGLWHYDIQFFGSAKGG